MLLIDNKLIFTFMPHTVAEVTKYMIFPCFGGKSGYRTTFAFLQLCGFPQDRNSV